MKKMMKTVKNKRNIKNRVLKTLMAKLNSTIKKSVCSLFIYEVRMQISQHYNLKVSHFI